MRRLLSILVLILVASSCSTDQVAIVGNEAGSDQAPEAVIDDAVTDGSAAEEIDTGEQATPRTEAPTTSTTPPETTALQATTAPDSIEPAPAEDVGSTTPVTQETIPPEPSEASDFVDDLDPTPEDLPADLLALLLDETDFDEGSAIDVPEPTSYFPGSTEFEECSGFEELDSLFVASASLLINDEEAGAQLIGRAPDSETAQALVSDFDGFEECFEAQLGANSGEDDVYGLLSNVEVSIEPVVVPGSDAAASWEISFGTLRSGAFVVAVGDVVSALSFETDSLVGSGESGIEPLDLAATAVQKIAAG